ncbi:probable DNA double-strand break repair Rad50 ATPase [Ostrea edulis]|uniref:probable DNA double-strand break repair Rad50 ATPase n=1 Tax=Ostrea edulis TaxID=37623 RepID=UPI0024AFC40B|nr:probable DNA double-strand break repair Rad50 ATPase [Ostrea edulis]
MQEMEERLNQLDHSDKMKESLKETSAKQEREYQELKKQYEDKDLHFRKALATAKKLKFQLQQSTSKKEDMETEIKSLRAELEKKGHFENESNDIKTDAGTEEKKSLLVTELKQKIMADESSIHILEEKLTAVDDLSQKLAECEDLLMTREKYFVVIQEELENRISELSSLSLKLTNSDKTIQDLETANRKLNDKLHMETERLTENIIEAESQKSEMHSQMVTLEEEKTQIQGLLQDKSEECVNLQAQTDQKIEDLHQDLQNSTNHESSYIKEEREHAIREKETLLSNIQQLKKKCEDLAQNNSNISDELLASEGQIQQLKFDNGTLRAQLGISRGGQMQMDNFHADYRRLQGHFSTAMDQKNKIQIELNQMAHRLQQRAARCQQMAMQHHALEKSLQMEREQRLQLEEALNTMQELARLVAENKQINLQIEDDEERILEASPMLSGLGTDKLFKVVRFRLGTYKLFNAVRFRRTRKR